MPVDETTVTSLQSTVVNLLPRRLTSWLSGVKSAVHVRRADALFAARVEELYGPSADREAIVATHDSIVYRVRAADGHQTILKLAASPISARRLVVEAAALDELATIESLGEWRALVAEVELRGDEGDVRWFAQTHLDGVPMSKLDGNPTTLVESAVGALAPLHEATAVQTELDDDVLERVVSSPLAVIARWRPELARELAAIDVDLCRRLSAGRERLNTVACAWRLCADQRALGRRTRLGHRRLEFRGESVAPRDGLCPLRVVADHQPPRM